MKVAVIPARGGSKRIPRKNIKGFLGKPMIAWSIDAAINSRCFDKVVVSTDDQEIAKVAVEYGATVPFMRPEPLADDKTGTVPVVQHAIKELKAQGICTTKVCCIYATAPFITPEDIRRGLTTLEESGSDFSFSVTSFPYPVQRGFVIKNGRVYMLDPTTFNMRSQDLEEVYHDAGQFYWGAADAWLNVELIFAPHSSSVILPRYRVQDIDTDEDWLHAEKLMKVILSENK